MTDGVSTSVVSGLRLFLEYNNLFLRFIYSGFVLIFHGNYPSIPHPKLLLSRAANRKKAKLRSTSQVAEETNWSEYFCYLPSFNSALIREIDFESMKIFLLLASDYCLSHKRT